ncbi:GNAT family N-acetyltransferase [Niallia sp. NCCP-28]|uniref:GNAT family N-acetyltransferase n=1 Tax=Niallia sp. NCCP-28 TaxID=2934712 RepID=UPI00208C975D|nr:GNAT family N-acetyltransferase [Niallia sp. NCCP-28]GKU82370.1 putative N-acetyltransferase YlbP [Niallia sp. NCCP-28]
MNTFIKKLTINYKTLEEFQLFNKKASDPLAITEELQHDLIENSLSSSFFGLYEEEKLVGRMQLNHSVEQLSAENDYLELCKVEILPEYQKLGLGKKFISFVKQFNKPIKTYPLNETNSFWEKLQFKPIKEKTNTSYVWIP